MSSSGLFDVLGVWAVGTPATVYPEGSGRWIRKGQTLRTNLHYHPNGTAQTDRTRVGLYFGKGELKKEVVAALAGNARWGCGVRPTGCDGCDWWFAGERRA